MKLRFEKLFFKNKYWAELQNNRNVDHNNLVLHFLHVIFCHANVVPIVAGHHVDLGEDDVLVQGDHDVCPSPGKAVRNLDGCIAELCGAMANIHLVFSHISQKTTGPCRRPQHWSGQAVPHPQTPASCPPPLPCWTPPRWSPPGWAPPHYPPPHSPVQNSFDQLESSGPWASSYSGSQIIAPQVSPGDCCPGSWQCCGSPRCWGSCSGSPSG
jgi:hypothetical protein